MKKLMVFAALFAVVGLTAEDRGFYCGFWVNAPRGVRSVYVHGCALGVPLSDVGKVKGVELSILASMSKRMHGFQYSWLGINHSQNVVGCQLSFANFATEGMDGPGFQVGLYNQSGRRGFQFGLVNNCRDNAQFQLGLVNLNPGGWLPFMIFFNFGR